MDEIEQQEGERKSRRKREKEREIGRKRERERERRRETEKEKQRERESLARTEGKTVSFWGWEPIPCLPLTDSTELEKTITFT